MGIRDVEDIERSLEDLKDEALFGELGVSKEKFGEIPIETPPESEMGDRGFPCFELAPLLQRAPDRIAAEIAGSLEASIDEYEWIETVEAVGPYVNFHFDRGAYAARVVSALQSERPGEGFVEEPETWAVEFSAPNTNKPQHLGHVRNNLIGDSVCRILEAAGHEPLRLNLINDRGIHICKSMLAYRKFGEGETPDSEGLKGDHLVGKYYRLFDEKVREEFAEWLESEEGVEIFEEWREDRKEDFESEARAREEFLETYEEKFFKRYSRLGAEAREMLRRWEEGHEEILELWRRMNSWVLEGFEETYRRLGIEFDDVYFESETYREGRDIVERGLEEGIFERLEDGAIAFDLSPLEMEGRKILMRRDETTVYMTQDLGTLVRRLEDHDPGKLVYVVGDEQDYHFRILFGIARILEPELEGRLHHLSYGMVFLPEGKLKSREGRVVDADELVEEMERLARREVDERYGDLEETERGRRAREIGLGALKFYLLNYNLESSIHFEPEESIEFQGETGPYCMYTYARIQSIKRENGGWPELDRDERRAALEQLGTELEMDVVRRLHEWPSKFRRSTEELDPSIIAKYLFELSRVYSSLYNDRSHRIIDLEDVRRRRALLLLSRSVSRILAFGLDLLGIDVLDEM